ncbi:ectoine/hydroxyectoine ABC transporter permease subunit EhuC [Collibacillus ludicampi]|uniref:Ectoine/hydroxyectoine ABC transporter permease subunit EhuC n=1 Tax=Collibacillus ludicampi TaxID=2771369 RepID=A0AAV4LDJ8_9BACL|nr:ectoine/hydroxyectoine ABC transporter permease subunit EhuC [Collibacillus ludicampi]GIM45810.1 ectoine/hydroxyectoine ABC transporter permease subunit EhuC [Collibacillus ludicampi]
MSIYSFLDLLPPLLKGAGITLEITILSMIAALFLAMLAGIGRLSKYSMIRGVTAIYVEVFRGTSLLVQLYWLYFALPILGIELPKMAAAVLALGLNYGAYGSEVVRGSILAVPKGHTEAGIALNMTPWQRMRCIIWPQAFVMMLPAFGNLLIELLKGTALVSLITLADLTFQAKILSTSTFQTTEIYTLLLVMYFILAYPITWGIRLIERRVAAGRS